MIHIVPKVIVLYDKQVTEGKINLKLQIKILLNNYR